MPRVLYVQYTNPAGYPPLEHSSRLLADAGWNVLFLGTRAFGADGFRFPPHSRVAVRQMSYCAGGWRNRIHYVWFGLWVLLNALERRPGWLYLSDPLSCPIGLALAFLQRVPVIYHEHDSPTLDGRRHSMFFSFVLWARRTLARRAVVSILPNETRARRFEAETGPGVRATCVWNCPSAEEAVPVRPDGNAGSLWLYYHGSIVPPRLPESVIHALSRLPDDVKLCVIGYETVGHVGYRQRLRDRARALGLDGRVEILTTVPRRGDLFQRGRHCHIGLSLLPISSVDFNEQAMEGASNKPFDYLACGMALIVSDLPDWRRLYVDPGYALACDPDSPESIAQAVLWYRDHPEEMRKMGERGRQRILAEWNYENQFGPVLNRMRSRAGGA